MAFGGAALVALAAAVWPRLGHGQGEITYFGHVAQFEGLEELNSALDQEVSANPSRMDHAAKRLLAMSRIIYDKYRYIRWGMGLFGVAVLLCTVAAVRALSV
jgi:hypothetical protein